MSEKKTKQEVVLEMVMDKSGFDKEDSFFKMHTFFRASKDLSEKHDEIYRDF